MTEKAQNADFRRKPQTFADSPLLLEIQALGGRRKPQIFAENRRFLQKTAGNRRSGSVRCVTFSSALMSSARCKMASSRVRILIVSSSSCLVLGVYVALESFLENWLFCCICGLRNLSTCERSLGEKKSFPGVSLSPSLPLCSFRVMRMAIGERQAWVALVCIVNIGFNRQQISNDCMQASGHLLITWLLQTHELGIA